MELEMNLSARHPAPVAHPYEPLMPTTQRPYRRVAASVAIAASVMFGACGASRKASTTAPKSASPTSVATVASPADTDTDTDTDKVAIKDFMFKPQAIAVKAGTEVTWTNGDDFAHTVKSEDGSFDSSDIAPAKTFSHRFDAAGTYKYFCNIHNSMTGSVTVS